MRTSSKVDFSKMFDNTRYCGYIYFTMSKHSYQHNIMDNPMRDTGAFADMAYPSF